MALHDGKEGPYDNTGTLGLLRFLLARVRPLAVAGFGLAGACASGDVQMRFAVDTPRQAYAAQLREVGLHTTALGRDWIAAAAVAYHLSVEQGQRLVARIDMAGATRSDARLFLDLFFRGRQRRESTVGRER